MISRRAVLGALAAVPALTAARAAGDAPDVLRIGYQKSGILSAVRRRGSVEARLKAVGVGQVRWVEFQYGPPIMEALGLGAIDLGAAGDTPPVFAQVAGAGIVYVAATPAQAQAILLPAGSKIGGLADLKGRTLAFARGSSAHNVAVAALAKAGLTPADITPAYLAPADAMAAFARGSVEAWSVWDPYYALAEERPGTHVLVDAGSLLETHSFYLASRDFAGRHPAVLTAALDGIREATGWAAQNRDELAAIMAEATGVPLAAQQRTVGRLGISMAPMSEAVVASQQTIADTFHRLGLVPRAITVRDAVWAWPQG